MILTHPGLIAFFGLEVRELAASSVLRNQFLTILSRVHQMQNVFLPVMRQQASLNLKGIIIIN